MLIKIIDCTESYNQDIEGIVIFFTNYFNALNIKGERIEFKDYRIVTCTQCRCCTQIKGEEPVKCVVKDDMNPLLDEIEEGNAYIISEDGNDLFNKNKIHEEVESRLIAYHCWSYGQTDSILRKPILKKTSILINYNTTKCLTNHSLYTIEISTEDVSAPIGAEVLDWQVTILTNDLIKDYARRLKELVDLLINSLKK